MKKNVVELRNSAEWQARRHLAAAHRLAVRDGLNEGTWNHFSLMSPDDPEAMLITPAHTHWSLVTASNLVLVRPDGTTAGAGSGGAATGPLRAGWIIHAPVHRARADAACVMHVHSPYVTALSMLTDVPFDTRSSQQAAGFHGDVAYFDTYDGVLEDESEGERMAAALGDGRVLILRNHGALVVGPSVARAYLDLYQLERACMYQMLARGAGDDVSRIPEDVAAETAKRARAGHTDAHFDGMLALIEAMEPDYRE